MITLDELIQELQRVRDEIGKDSPIRMTVFSENASSSLNHHAIIRCEALEYDEDVKIVLLRSGPVVATGG